MHVSSAFKEYESFDLLFRQFVTFPDIYGLTSSFHCGSREYVVFYAVASLEVF